MTTLLDEIISILSNGSNINIVEDANRIVQAAQSFVHDDQANTARAMAKRRAAGTPLAYVIGHEIFMGIDLIVAEGALAPREETELLGNTAIETIRSYGKAPRVIDMCCGSGNLACAIAHHIPGAHVWASDLTDDCIAVTRKNVSHVGVSDRVVVAQGDLFTGLAGLVLEGTIDVIVCNPPYISRGRLATDRAELLEHEPREAFDGGPYGLSIHQRVIKEALQYLRPGGILLFEIGLGQERQVKMLFERTNEYNRIQSFKNDGGQIRVMSAIRSRNNDNLEHLSQ